MSYNYLNTFEHTRIEILSKNQLTLSIHLDSCIPYHDSVRLLRLLLEELDATLLHQAYSPYGRKSVVPPTILFKLIIYKFMNQIYSFSRFEKAYRTHLLFIWLFDAYPALDHNTLHGFKNQRLANIVMRTYFINQF